MLHDSEENSPRIIQKNALGFVRFGFVKLHGVNWLARVQMSETCQIGHSRKRSPFRRSKPFACSPSFREYALCPYGESSVKTGAAFGFVAGYQEFESVSTQFANIHVWESWTLARLVVSDGSSLRLFLTQRSSKRLLVMKAQVEFCRPHLRPQRHPTGPTCLQASIPSALR